MRGVAPCGHEGDIIIGRFVLCSRGCDSRGGREMRPRCPRCQSPLVEAFYAVGLPPDARHCVACGVVWADGVDT